MKITSSVKKIVEQNPLAFATVGNKKPYVIGVTSCKVVEGDKILITDNFMKTTVRNLLTNNNVALVVWNKRWKGYQFLGKAKYYKNGKWLNYVKNLKANKEFPAKGAIVVKVEKIIESK
jgi:predicted pyridoxine 5'-phosphate oxidase superfamily flavin-nucleotide-binding protein